jgi:hypothetical protein
LDRACRYLDQTKNGILGALRNISEPQWRFKPGPNRWAIVEIVEHVAAVQELVLGPLQERLNNAPVTPLQPGYRLVDDIIIYQFPNRLRTLPSPLPPANGLMLSEARTRLSANYAARSGRLEARGLRDRAIDSAPLKAVTEGAYDTMDGYQWILAAAAHTERHTKQILEVMAEPGFPV